MKYDEYRIKMNGGLERSLGILGETHIYRPEESEFAEDIIDKYDNCAFEGAKKLNLKQVLLGLALAPTYISLSGRLKYFGRSGKNKKARQIVERKGKNTHYFNDTKYINLPRMALLFAVGTIGALTIPFFYVARKLRKLAGKNEFEHKTEISSRQTRFMGYIGAVPKRDKVMASQTIEILENKKNVLVNCGEYHMNGILKNIRKDPRVEGVRKIGKTREPVYDTSYAPRDEYVFSAA